MRTVVLFDIDGTLISTAGAGRAALDAAVAEVTGFSGALAGVPIAGRTDRAIIAEALANANFGGGPLEAVFESVVEAYRRLLPGHIASVTGSVLPGVAELFRALDVASAVSTLATGNLRIGAEIKLNHFSLWRPGFERGGFGDASAVRAEVVRAAMLHHRNGSTASFVVVGDTPHDISAAHEAGARAIAVATGTFTTAALAETGADAIFPDLSDTTAVVRSILAL